MRYLLSCLLLCSGPALAGPSVVNCGSLEAVDGDTIRCDGQRMRPMGPGAPYVSGFDAPELGGRAQCESERQLALRAKARMEELLQTPGLVVEDSGELDPFQRPLIWLRLPDGFTIGEVMLREGLARVWRPGHRIDWCND